jgi:uncharacterized protein
MKLHLQSTGSTHLITAYGEDYVAVNGVRHDRSLIVLPGQIINAWQAAGPDELTEAHFSVLEGYELEVLLLGTGARLHFPSPRLMQALARKGVGLETMDTRAACRTYNILAAEGRKVAAALILTTE